ncbi:MFS transporter [Bradyrhizobium erythrophlei]|uniref:MFS transporter n=1 Tax=Bradyrhizobium erythrophlei TaxID=1437360 RepID=UPI0035E56117
MYLSFLIIQIGSWAFRVGILIGLLQSNMSAAGVGVAVIFAPITLGSLFLSPLVDRDDPLTVMMIVNAIRVCALLSIFCSIEINSFSTYVSIVVLSLVQPIYLSAQVSYFRRITPEDGMISVLGNITNIEWLTYLLGMFAAAMLVGPLRLPGVLALNITAALVSLIVLFVIRQHSRKAAGTFGKPPSGTILDLTPLYPALFAVFLLNLGAGIINIYPAIRATAGGGLDRRVLLAIVMTNGVFGLLGALSVKPIFEWLGALPTIAGAAALTSASLVAMSLDASLALVVASSSAMLGLSQIFAVSAHTYMVSSVAPDRAGRLSGLFQSCTYGGFAGNGILFSILGDELSFGLIVLMCAGSAFLGFGVATFAISRSTHCQISRTIER